MPAAQKTVPRVSVSSLILMILDIPFLLNARSLSVDNLTLEQMVPVAQKELLPSVDSFIAPCLASSLPIEFLRSSPKFCWPFTKFWPWHSVLWGQRNSSSFARVRSRVWCDLSGYYCCSDCTCPILFPFCFVLRFFPTLEEALSMHERAEARSPFACTSHGPSSPMPNLLLSS